MGDLPHCLRGGRGTRQDLRAAAIRPRAGQIVGENRGWASVPVPVLRVPPASP
jgi:hypothetical protein